MKFLKFFFILIITTVIFLLNKNFIAVHTMFITMELSSKEAVGIAFYAGGKEISKRIIIPECSNREFTFRIEYKNFPGSFDIVLSDIYAPVIINNIRSNDLSFIDGFEFFTSDTAKLKTDNNRLLIEPSDNNVTLTYNNSPVIIENKKDNILLFILILAMVTILSFIATPAYKKILKPFFRKFGDNYADKAFVFIFFTLLIISLTNITTADVSKQEKRILSKFPELITDNKININFGSEFADWFNDHFGFREILINFHDNLIYVLTTGGYYEDKQTIFNKKADFSFNKDDLKIFLRKKLFTEEDLNKIYNNIVKLKEYCDKKNIKLYVLLSNGKESVYPELYPAYYHPYKNPSQLEIITDLLKSIPGLNIISAKDELFETKKEEPVFMNYDLHMTPKGAYIEYYKIISEIKKSYPNITPVNYSETKSSISNDFTNAPPFIKNNPPEMPSGVFLKQKNNILIKSELTTKNKFDYYIFKNDKLNYKLTAVIIGDSFQHQYKHIAAEHFSSYKSIVFGGSAVKMHFDDESRKLFFEEKPDILIIECAELRLSRLLATDFITDIFGENDN